MSVFILLVGLVLVAPLAAIMAPTIRAALPLWSARLRPVGGPATGWRTAAWCAAAVAGLFAVFTALGFVARGIESAVDHPVYGFFTARQVPALTDSMRVLTVIGDQAAIQRSAAVSAVLLAVLWPRRRWVPVVLEIGILLTERYLQFGLAKLVDRGHPPGEPGTWPSGGCARLVCVYGMIILLTLVGIWLRRGRVPDALAVGLGTLLLVATWAEAFSRTYLGKHWVTDVVGGVAFGFLLLGVGGYALLALAPEPVVEPAAAEAVAAA